MEVELRTLAVVTTWINDEEKKTTTSTALAVGRFHLDGASHLERGEKKKRGNGEVRSRRLGGGGLSSQTTTRGHKTGVAKVPLSHTNGCSAMLIKVPQLQRGTKNTIMQLSWPDTPVFLLPVIQCKQKSLSRFKMGYICVCVYVCARLCVQSHL